MLNASKGCVTYPRTLRIVENASELHMLKFIAIFIILSEQKRILCLSKLKSILSVISHQSVWNGYNELKITSAVNTWFLWRSTLSMLVATLPMFDRTADSQVNNILKDIYHRRWCRVEVGRKVYLNLCRLSTFFWQKAKRKKWKEENNSEMRDARLFGFCQVYEKRLNLFDIFLFSLFHFEAKSSNIWMVENIFLRRNKSWLNQLFYIFHFDSFAIQIVHSNLTWWIAEHQIVQSHHFRYRKFFFCNLLAK